MIININIILNYLKERNPLTYFYNKINKRLPKFDIICFGTNVVHNVAEFVKKRFNFTVSQQ